MILITRVKNHRQVSNKEVIMNIHRLKRIDDRCTPYCTNDQSLKGRNLATQAFKEYLQENIYQTRKFL